MRLIQTKPNKCKSRRTDCVPQQSVSCHETFPSKGWKLENHAPNPLAFRDPGPPSHGRGKKIVTCGVPQSPHNLPPPPSDRPCQCTHVAVPTFSFISDLTFHPPLLVTCCAASPI